MHDDTRPPFLQAQITKPADRKSFKLSAGQAHHGLPIQSLNIESVKPASLKPQKMCASDSRLAGASLESESLIPWCMEDLHHAISCHTAN